MAEIQMQDAVVPAWGTLSLSTEMLRRRLSGLAASDLTLADSGALTDQVQRLKAQLQNEDNVEQGLVRDCDALAVEILGLKAMEQRIVQSNGAILERSSADSCAIARAIPLSKLSELQIAASHYVALR